MPREDELRIHGLRMLVYLYKKGAVDPRSAVRFADLGGFLQLDEAVAHEVIESAKSSGLLKVSGAAKRSDGTSYAGAKFWSTRRGFDEGERWWRAWFGEPAEDEMLDPRAIEEMEAHWEEAYSFWSTEIEPHMKDWYPDSRS